MKLAIIHDDGTIVRLGNGDELLMAEDALIEDIVTRIDIDAMMEPVRLAVVEAAARERVYRRARAAGNSLGDVAGRSAFVALRKPVSDAVRGAILAFKRRTLNVT